jgi:hypothetical protein
MIRIKDRNCQRVPKNGSRFLEGNAMLPKVCSRFRGVPFEFDHRVSSWDAIWFPHDTPWIAGRMARVSLMKAYRRVDAVSRIIPRCSNTGGYKYKRGGVRCREKWGSPLARPGEVRGTRGNVEGRCGACEPWDSPRTSPPSTSPSPRGGEGWDEGRNGGRRHRKICHRIRDREHSAGLPYHL